MQHYVTLDIQDITKILANKFETSTENVEIEVDSKKNVTCKVSCADSIGRILKNSIDVIPV